MTEKLLTGTLSLNTNKTFVSIERLWHRIKENNDICWYSFYSFLAFLSFFYRFISTALPLPKSAGDDDTLST